MDIHFLFPDALLFNECFRLKLTIGHTLSSKIIGQINQRFSLQDCLEKKEKHSLKIIFTKGISCNKEEV